MAPPGGCRAFAQNCSEAPISHTQAPRQALQWFNAIVPPPWDSSSSVCAISQISLWPPQGGTVCPNAQIQRESLFYGARIRCVLVHDHVLLRQGLRSLLDSETDLEG